MDEQCEIFIQQILMKEQKTCQKENSYLRSQILSTTTPELLARATGSGHVLLIVIVVRIFLLAFLLLWSKGFAKLFATAVDGGLDLLLLLLVVVVVTGRRARKRATNVRL